MEYWRGDWRGVGDDAIETAMVRVLWYCRCKRIYMIRRKSCILGSWEGK